MCMCNDTGNLDGRLRYTEPWMGYATLHRAMDGLRYTEPWMGYATLHRVMDA